jgi:hypothetical protein
MAVTEIEHDFTAEASAERCQALPLQESITVSPGDVMRFSKVTGVAT